MKKLMLAVVLATAALALAQVAKGHASVTAQFFNGTYGVTGETTVTTVIPAQNGVAAFNRRDTKPIHQYLNVVNGMLGGKPIVMDAINTVFVGGQIRMNIAVRGVIVRGLITFHGWADGKGEPTVVESLNGGGPIPGVVGGTLKIHSHFLGSRNRKLLGH